MALKIAVTPAGYDNIGKVLHAMEYSFDSIKENTLTDSKALAGYDVIFINCSGTCANGAKPATNALAGYVANGGALYCSDYASDYIAAAFPDKVKFGGKAGGSGNLTARVVDVGLQAIIGRELPLHFDMGAWETIKSVSNDAEVYLDYDKGRPLLITFKHGQGEVIYTCFHNQAQHSEKEQKLLKFLVIKPLLARAKSGIDQFVVGKAHGSVENVGVISSGKTSADYQFDAKKAEDLRFLLNWVGEAELAFSVFRPDGSLEREAKAIAPPVEIEVPNAPAGRWRYHVRAVHVPERNFPFILMAGPATQLRVMDPSFWEGWGPRAATAQPNSAVLDLIEIEEVQSPTILDDIEIDFGDL